MVEHFLGVCPSFWSWKLPSFLILGSKCVEYFVPVLVWGIITTCLQWSGLPGQGECDGKLDNLRNFQQSFLVHSWWPEKIFAKLFKVEWCPKQGKTCLILSRVFSWSTSVSDHQVTHIQCSIVTYFTLSPPQRQSWWPTNQKWWLASWLKLLAPSEGDGPWPANHWITMVTRGREGVKSCWNLWMSLWWYDGVNSNLSAPSLTRGLWNSLPGRLWIEAQHCSQ